MCMMQHGGSKRMHSLVRPTTQTLIFMAICTYPPPPVMHLKSHNMKAECCFIYFLSGSTENLR